MLTATERSKRRSDARFDRQYMAYNSARAEMVRIWSGGAEDLDTLETILAKRSALIASGTWKAMSAYHRAACIGVSDAMSDIVRRKHLVWTHVMDGRRVDSREVPNGHHCMLNVEDSAHAYRGPDGTLVPWREAERSRDLARLMA